MTTVTFTLNGADVTVSVDDRTLLSDALREAAGARDVHVGCEHGVCGVCTVLVDGLSVRSCLLLAVQVAGSTIETVRSLGTEEQLSDLQGAFIRHHALQCGYCTPAMLLVAEELLQSSLTPGEAEIREAISGVTCRCTGYQNIVDAIAAVADSREATRR